MVFRFGFLFEADAFLLLFEPRGVVDLAGDAVAAAEFEDPACDVIEEIPVVGDGDDGAFVVAQVMFEPRQGFGVEVVGGFVEQENIGFGEFGVDLIEAGEHFDDGRDRQFHDFEFGLAFVEFGFLLEQADSVAFEWDISPMYICPRLP